MPLRVELKPFERIVIGETVLINSGTRTSFLIDGEAPILRERDTITAETANTPAKQELLRKAKVGDVVIGLTTPLMITAISPAK